MVDTVGDILGDTHEEPKAPQRFAPPSLPGTPEMPAPGLYFGMSDEAYHAIPALSNSGIKKLAASPMIFWASTSWLSEAKRKADEEAKREKGHYTLGKAYHCRLMEGIDAYAARFAVALDPADYPDALESTAQIKAAIEQHEREQPVSPVGGKADLIEQLRGLRADHPLVLPNAPKFTVDDLKTEIRLFKRSAPVQPIRKVPDTLPDGTEYMRDAVKADWIAQLLTLDPEAKVFANLDAQHRAQHAGKIFLTPEQHAELEIAALMVDRDPELKNAFQHGHAEVVFIWYCPATGVPMKARIDYLKVKMMVDLKSIANQRERSIENAIRFEIAAYKYNLQPVVYFEGAKIVRDQIRRHGLRVIHHARMDSGDMTEDEFAPYAEFAFRWAKHSKPDEWLWVFQQKGAAPITRGVWFPRGGTTQMVTADIIAQAKRRFHQFAEAFGTDPWLDVKPSYQIADEDIPQSATEI